eukprot:7986913-Pyramimonas_sp.AAC.1
MVLLRRHLPWQIQPWRRVPSPAQQSTPTDDLSGNDYSGHDGRCHDDHCLFDVCCDDVCRIASSREDGCYWDTRHDYWCHQCRPQGRWMMVPTMMNHMMKVVMA